MPIPLHDPDQLAIWRKCDQSAAFEGSCLFAGLRIPKLHSIAISAGCNKRAIRGKGHACHAKGTGGQGCFQFAGGKTKQLCLSTIFFGAFDGRNLAVFIQFDRFVFIGCHRERAAVRRKCNRGYPSRVSRDRRFGTVSAQVPNLDCSVMTATDKESAIGRKGDGRHGCCVALERAKRGRGEIPIPDGKNGSYGEKEKKGPPSSQLCSARVLP